MEHTGTVDYKPGNFEQYRFEGNCSCGWHTKQAELSQATSSLQGHITRYTSKPSITVTSAAKVAAAPPVATPPPPAKPPAGTTQPPAPTGT